MQIPANVKQILYKIIGFGFIAFVLSSCISGGDSYTSMVCGSIHEITQGRSYQCTYKYGFKVSNDRRSVRAFYSSTDNYSNWVDLKQGGAGIISGNTYFEIKSHMLRVKYNDYAGWGNWVDLCGSGASESYENGTGIKVEVNNGKARYCYTNNNGTTCGNWVAFDKSYVCASCPSGYTYNSSRKICEADPVINYTCPYGGTCVEESRGIAYCSPYNCVSDNNGVWCANGDINTNGMTANNIGMWQCSKDGSWYINAESCKTGCNYWQCEYDSKWINGDYLECKTYCREKGQCQAFPQ